MPKAIKWIGIVSGGLIGLVLIAAVGLYARAELKLGKTYAVQAEPISVPTDAEAIHRGEHWVSVYCMGCHGEDLSGVAVFDDPALGSVAAPNLTPGQGGAGSEFADHDWVLAIRHGVDPHEMRGLLIMPAESLYYLSDRDLGDMIAYLKTVRPVDREWPEPEFTPMARILLGLGAFGEVIPAEMVDHAAPRPAAVEAGVNEAYAEYLAKAGGCLSCHGAELSGGKSPDPAAPPAPNLTPGGKLGGWSETDFITAMRTGATPGGGQMTAFMPWKDTANMTDEELRALWMYLVALPALDSAVK